MPVVAMGGTMKPICSVGLTILLCMTTGCCTKRLKGCQNLKADDPKIIEFANKCATTCSSRDLTTYGQPKITEQPNYWIVTYTGKEPTVGNYFGIVIDKKTCKGELMPGS